MYNILIVDNQPDVRNTLRGILVDNGHTVHLAANEGGALLAVTQQRFDFALIDLRLHEEGEDDDSGLSLAMAIRAIKPQIRVILLTQYVRTRQIVRAIRYLGAVGFIEKTPDVGRQILKTIAEVAQETKRPKSDETREMTRLSLSLATNQSLVIRSRGRHVCSARTLDAAKIEADELVRQTESARKSREDMRFQIKKIGRDLWRSIFAEHREVLATYHQACAKSQLLKLHFETSRELLRLPLEFLRSDEPDEYLILQHPFARFVYNTPPKREAISPQMMGLTEKLRVLIIASNTQPPIDGVDAEAQSLHDYLIQQDCIPIEVKLLPTESATYERVKEEVKKPNYDIIHYAGHGQYNSASPEDSGIFFWTGENKQGNIAQMKATELKWLLEHSEARFMYLSNCYGATSGSQMDLLDDDFLGLADVVIQAGVPSVLGFRWPISDTGAVKLARAFYQCLLEQGSPEIALWSARCDLAASDRNDPIWLSPILIHQE